MLARAGVEGCGGGGGGGRGSTTLKSCLDSENLYGTSQNLDSAAKEDEKKEKKRRKYSHED